jgi:Tol biopolymer transport system component
MMSNVTGGQLQVYVRDVVGGSTALASASTYGAPATGYQVAIDDQALSDDGRFVVFASDAPNLVNDDTNGLQDVFLRDMVNGTTQRVSADSRGQTPLLQSRNPSGDAVIDGSGRFVVYQNGARLVAFDAETDLSFNVDVASSFKEYANSATVQPALAADGRTIVYSSVATNLVPDDTDSGSDIYVVDLDPRD